MADIAECMLSKKRTAKLLGVCENTVELWSNPKSKYFLPNFPAKYRFGDKPGSRVAFKLSEVMAFIESCRQQEALTNE